jgi:phosphohistidine phosphatase SixA
MVRRQKQCLVTEGPRAARSAEFLRPGVDCASRVWLSAGNFRGKVNRSDDTKALFAERIWMRAGLLGVASVGIVVLGILAGSARADEGVWELLRAGGQVVLIRHASTEPGLGDPPGFRLDDCATQRNLSEAGRDEARRIWAAFQRRGVPIGRVLSSRWCRCLETARVAFERVEPWPPLDSFFDDRGREPDQTRAVRALMDQPISEGNLILVTHQVNITAITGIVPAMGEMIVLTPQPGGTVRVAGRLGPAEFSEH